MREQFLSVFDTLRIDNLNGDKYATGKLTPTGESDPSAFSTAQNREGIQVGTAIATLTRHGAHKPDVVGKVTLRQWWGRDKLAALAASIAALPSDEKYEPLKPHPALRLAFFDGRVADGYVDWPTIVELFPVSFPGVKTSRDSALVDIDEGALVTRMQRYFDATVSDAEILRDAPALMESTARFNATKTRSELVAKGYASGKLLRYCYRPMDVRWLYWHGATKLLDEKRPELAPQSFAGNRFLVTQQKPRREWSQPEVISMLGCLDLMDRSASCIPLYLHDTNDFLKDASVAHFNLTDSANAYLKSINGFDHADDLFFHAIAVMHSTAYRAENEGGLRQDWPRIPLPASAEALRASTLLGREVTALLDTESSVVGVDSGPIRPELKAIAMLRSTRGDQLSADEFAVTAGWGSGGKDGVTMPGKGKTVQRVADGIEAPNGAATPAGEPLPMTMDVYLNATAYWKNVPLPVWNFTIGGYQVMKKWLSYREEKRLGRALTLDELDYVTAMARRLAALVSLQAKLDENYRAVTTNGYAWPRVGAVGGTGLG